VGFKLLLILAIADMLHLTLCESSDIFTYFYMFVIS